MVQFNKYPVGLCVAPLLIRNVHSILDTHPRYSSTSVLTQLLPRVFLAQHTIVIVTLLLAGLLVCVLSKRYHVHSQLAVVVARLRRAAATSLIVLAISLDSSSEHGILAQDPSTPQV